jgi:peptide/nickel transport system ATP-binding protein
VQAGVVNLLRTLQEEHGLSYLFIAHDLSVVANIADRIAVMHLGRIVEIGPTEEIFSNPRHPYTRALISAVPIPDPDTERGRDPIRLAGDVPSPMEQVVGCNFRSRCPIYHLVLTEQQQARCRGEHPPLEEATPGHQQACYFPDHFAHPSQSRRNSS